MQLILEHAEDSLYQQLVKGKGDFANQLALLVKLSSVRRAVPDYQVKVFVNLFAKLLTQEQGNVYLCKDQDIIILSKRMDYTQLDKVKTQIKTWLVEERVASGLEESEFYLQLYNLSFNFDDFAQLIEKKFFRHQASVIKAHSQITGYKNLLDKLYQMIELTNKLQNVSIAPFLRQQPIYLMHGSQVKPVISELHVSLKHLREAHHVKLDALYDRPIFWYLLELLDQRVLPHLAAHHADYFADLPLSVNINVNTIFSQIFTEFNAEFPNKLRQRLTWEIHINDIYHDFKLYLSAIDYLQELGYNILVDRVNLLNFEQINRVALRANIIKLTWDSEQLSMLTNGYTSRFSSAIEALGSSRVVLTQCTDSSAIEFGKEIGIKLYQGWWLDKNCVK